MMDFFEDDECYFLGPPLTNEMVSDAEHMLGVKLPEAYLLLLKKKNGGTPKRRCFPMSEATSWAVDHIMIEAILGIGGEWGIDSSSGMSSPEMVEEWDYPNIGVVICHMPSGGHDTVMLDYRECGVEGEPSVAYIDEDRIPRRIANSFSEFILGLVDCSEFPID